MKPVTVIAGTAVPVPLSNVDTDTLIRIDRLIDNEPGELGPYFFEALRYRPGGTPDPAFPLNQERYRGACILVAGPNFGCGSSREHAVWAAADFGLRCVIAPSLGDIFRNNCFQNGVLPIELPEPAVQKIMEALGSADRPELRVDLTAECITLPGGEELAFSVDPERRQALLEGLDDIGLTLQRSDAIAAWEARDEEERPWVYPHD